MERGGRATARGYRLAYQLGAQEAAAADDQRSHAPHVTGDCAAAGCFGGTR